MTDIFTNFSDIISNPHFYVLIILVIVIITIGYFIRRSLEKKHGVGAIRKKSKINSRQILYIALYVYYGYHFPNNFVEFLIMAIAWKLVEQGICSSFVAQVTKCNYSSSNFLCEAIELIGNCEHAQWKDILFNMMAFVCGSLIFKIRH